MAAKIKAKAQKLDIEVERGSTLNFKVTWKDSNGTPIDLSTYGGRLQIRESYGDPVISEYSTTIIPATPTPVTGNGKMVLTATGDITFVITAEESSAWDPDFVSGIYDLELVAPDFSVRRLLEGEVSTIPEVTL